MDDEKHRREHREHQAGRPLADRRQEDPASPDPVAEDEPDIAGEHTPTAGSDPPNQVPGEHGDEPPEWPTRA